MGQLVRQLLDLIESLGKGKLELYMSDFTLPKEKDLFELAANSSTVDEFISKLKQYGIYKGVSPADTLNLIKLDMKTIKDYMQKNQLPEAEKRMLRRRLQQLKKLSLFFPNDTTKYDKYFDTVKKSLDFVNFLNRKRR